MNASPSSPSSAAPERRGFDALARAVEVEVPADIAGSVRLLADFALKLSLGPISRQWVPEVRRSVEALLLTGKHRHETALVALSARLLEVLPDGSPVARHEAEEATACTETSAASEGDAAPDVSVGDAAGVASAAGPDAEASVSPEPSAAEASTGTEHDRVAAASDASDSAAASNGGPDAGALAPEALAPEASQVNGVDGNAVDGAVATNANELAATAAEATPPVDPALAPQLGASPEAASAPVDQPNAPLPDTLPPTTSVPDTLPSDPLLPDASLEDAVLRGTLRERVLHELSRLAGVLAEWPAPAQDLAEEARRRETQVMRQLLEQVDGLRRDQRARLEEQMRLEDLASMSPAAIAEEFDAPLERASELRRVLDAYRQERQRRAPDVANSVGLSLALDELESRCAAFDDCDQEQRDVVRTLRARRRQALTAVNLLLAERGELEWLEQLEPLAIGERVERLKHWLDAGSEGSY